jgi:CheY-like chemotaxis protein
MADFWVLIVDDEDGVLSVLKNSLRKLGDQFRVSTATGGEEAMDMLIQRKYDLVVTDYKMAGMNGLELMEKVHAAHPETRVILMTAYGSAAVESEASRLQAYRYLAKPLEIEAFRKIVREAAGADAETSGILVLAEKDYREVDRILCQLQGDVAARCILLTDSEGRCMARAGNVEDLDLAQIGSLLGGSMTTLGEAGRAVDPSNEGVNLAYREGKREDLYAVNVGPFLLVIVVDRGPYSSRLGSVWYAAQKAAAELREKFRTADIHTSENTLGEDMEQALYGELQKIFIEDGPGPRMGSTDKTRPSDGKPSHPALLTYDEAVQSGILPDT